MTSLRSELKVMVLATCKEKPDDVYRKWMKICGVLTEEALPPQLKAPFALMRVRVFLGAVDKGDCWTTVAKGWNDAEENEGEFQALAEQSA